MGVNKNSEIKRNARMQVAATHIAAGKSLEGIAKLMNMSSRTLYRWLIDTEFVNLVNKKAKNLAEIVEKEEARLLTEENIKSIVQELINLKPMVVYNKRDITLVDVNKYQPTPSIRFMVLKRDDYKCRICGRTAQDGVKLEVDHIYPASKGGDNNVNNLWTLCYECNRGKGVKEI